MDVSDVGEDSHSLQTPEGVSIVRGPLGLRFVGHAEPLLGLCEVIRGFGSDKEMTVATIGTWELRKSDEYSVSVPGSSTITYPASAWRTVAGVLTDVATGVQRSPLDFGDVRFCERSIPDIGVSLTGITRYDLQRPNLQSPDYEISVLNGIEDQLRKHRVGLLVRIGDASGESWTVDVVSEENGSTLKEGLVWAPSMEATIEQTRAIIRQMYELIC